jgi:hypothetical protein
MTLLPLHLLRSVIRFVGDPDADVLQNLDALRAEVQLAGSDSHLLTFIGHIADKSQQVPDFTTVYVHYTNLSQNNDPNGLSGQIRLGEVEQAQLPFLDPAAFRAALDRYKDEVTGETLGILLQQTSQILQGGYAPPVTKGKPVMLRGPAEGVAFMEAGLTTLSQRFYRGDIEGSLKLNASDVWDRYTDAKVLFQSGQPTAGVCSGFTAIDVAHDGLQPGDLALVVGFTSQYKSTFCYNWAYNAAVYYGKNVAIIPLEMPAQSLLRLLAVLHCYHPDYRSNPNYARIAVRYDAVRRGTLTPIEEQLFETALTDLQTNPAYGTILYKEPRSTITTVGQIQRWAEQQHRKTPLDMLLIDYAGLVNPTSGDNSLRDSSIANAALREIKQMATGFANGQGLAVLSPWQASRDGFKEAEKNAGQYTLRALSWANEAERSADLVYSVFTDETLRGENRIVWGNLKARDRQQITGTAHLYCYPEARIIDNSPAPVASPLGANPVSAAVTQAITTP